VLGFQNGSGGKDIHFVFKHGVWPAVFLSATSGDSTYCLFHASLDTSSPKSRAPNPTPAAAPSPNPVPSGSCARQANHVPGGPDGTGTCWPGPDNTGVPLGTVLTTYDGPCTITVAETVIDSKIVNCSLAVMAANIVLRNSKVNGSVILDTNRTDSSLWSLTIQDSEVDAGTDPISAVGWGNVAVIRSNIHGGATAVQCEENSISCLVQDSYLHGQYLPDDQPWHLGGFLSDGGQNITLRHNYVVCDHAANSLGTGCTGDINLIPNFAAINGALIEHNLFGANMDLAYCTYGGERSNSPTPHSYNVAYKDNVFQRGKSKICGAYGLVTGFNIKNTGNQWINNRFEDGAIVYPAN
jgi:hypothetical protein